MGGNPLLYRDPKGTFAIPGEILLGGGLVCMLTPGCAKIIQDAAKSAAKTCIDFKNNLEDILLNEGDNGEAPPLPTDLVGDQSDPRAGPNRSGKRHTSGPLTPENGGTGDYDEDLEQLTGGTRPYKPGDKAPPGSQVGENGIYGRPNSSGGMSIDIPANGNKPHETLHY